METKIVIIQKYDDGTIHKSMDITEKDLDTKEAEYLEKLGALIWAFLPSEIREHINKPKSKNR